MKKTLFVIAILISSSAFGQQGYECINHYQMPVSSMYEGTLGARQDMDDYYETEYSNLTYVQITTGSDGGASSNFSFDCMSYSIFIHTFEKEDTMQIGGDFYLYEDYGLIEEVSTPEEGDIVFYMEPAYNGNIGLSKHSAILLDINTVSDPGDDYVRSKWGQGPLAEHSVKQCPWYNIGTTTFKYYSKVDNAKTIPPPTLSGSAYINCTGSKTYAVSLPDGDYPKKPEPIKTWAYDAPIQASIYNDEYYADMSIPGNTQASTATVKVSVEYCDTTTSKSKTVYIGKPHTNKLEFFSDPWGQEHELSTCETVSGEADYAYGSISAYEWDIPNASDWEIAEEYSGPADYQFVEIDYWEDPAPSTETVRVRATNNCGTGLWKSIEWDVDDCGGYYMMISPNPADDLLTLSFMSKEEIDYNEGLKSNTNSEVTRNWKELPEYEVLILHEDKGLIKKLSSQDKQLEINTANLEPGMYFVHIIIEGKKYEDKLIIKR